MQAFPPSYTMLKSVLVGLTRETRNHDVRSSRTLTFGTSVFANFFLRFAQHTEPSATKGDRRPPPWIGAPLVAISLKTGIGAGARVRPGREVGGVEPWAEMPEARHD